MARTINEIYSGIITEKENQPTLSGLLPLNDNVPNLLNDINSNSKVGRWRLFAFVFTAVTWVHENLWDLFRADVEHKLAIKEPGTLPWYRELMLKYQHGHFLQWIDNKYQYLVDDPAARIITQCAVTEFSGQVKIKVAKTAGDLVPLTTTELNGARSYLRKTKFAGTAAVVISLNPDLVKTDLTIRYDPQIPLSILQPNVEAAVVNHLSHLAFDSIFNKTRFIDALQIVPGVIDIIINGFEAKHGINNYASIGQNYEAIAGYMRVETPFPLPAISVSGTTTITGVLGGTIIRYVANV